MPIKGYGVWAAKPVRYTYEDRHQDDKSPHLSLFYTDNDSGEGRAAINIKSGNLEESRLAYWTVSKFEHPVTTDLASLQPGFKPLDGTDGLALDFIRGNLFDRSTGRILPHDVDGPDNDILDQLKPILDRAIAEDATAYIYGTEFDNGKGTHNVHMNQGNTGRWLRDNGVFQDGGLIIQFKDHWEAVFIGFASQAVHTDDGPGKDAGNPVPKTGFLTWANFLSPDVPPSDREGDDLTDSPVAITEALVNPPGPDGQPGSEPETVTLTNRTENEVDVSGWSIKNKASQRQILPPGSLIAAKAALTVAVPQAPLSNQGGTITLLNADGLKVSGVSYSKEQAREGRVPWN
ncbi:DUF2278 domain containing protein [Naviculisporaceae sp. PSN 640]